LTGTEQRYGEEDTGEGRAEQRDQEQVRLLDFGDHNAMAEEDCRGQDQDGEVYQQGGVERNDGIDQIVAAGAAFAGFGVTDLAGLHQGRMQVEIMGHHGGAEHSDGDVEALAADVGNHAEEHLGGDRLGEDDLDAKAGGHDGDEGEDEGFDVADAETLEPEQQEGIGGGEEDADQKRDVKEEVEGDGGAEHFGQIAGGDGDLAEDPEGDGDGARVGFAAGLGEVAAGDDTEAGAEGLEKDGHEVRHDQDPDEGVAEARATFEVGGPIAGVHVADADEIGGSGEGEHAAPDGHVGGVHGGVDVGEGAGVRFGGGKHSVGCGLNYS